MLSHVEISDQVVRSKIRRKIILWGGNKKLKIYGTLHCGSGKRMKRENRVFFESEEEALRNEYRPCGHCLRKSYQKWKYEIV